MAKVASVNNLPATGGEAMFIVKTVAVSAGWSITRSGDGLALFSNVGDILTTGVSGAGGLGNTNAWFEMRDPASRVCFTFQRITGTTWRAKYTETGAFAGGTPGISRTGTATDEQVLYGAGTDASPTGTQMLHTDGGTYRFAVFFQSTIQPSNGTYSFWFAGSPSFSNVGVSFFGLDGMLAGTYHPSDQIPRAIITWYANPPVAAGWTAVADTVFYARSWTAYGLAGATFRRFGMATYMAGVTTGTGATATGGIFTNSVQDYNLSGYSSVDQPMPLLLARVTNHGSFPGPKGFCHSFLISTANRQYPQTINLTTDAFMYFGGLAVPWPNNLAGAF